MKYYQIKNIHKKDDMMLGQVLRNIRLFHKIKLVDLATELEISSGYLSEIERGLKVPTLEVVNKYSSKFGISSSGILFFSENFNELDKLKKVKQFIGNKAIKLIEYMTQNNVLIKELGK